MIKDFFIVVCYWEVLNVEVMVSELINVDYELIIFNDCLFFKLGNVNFFSFYYVDENIVVVVEFVCFICLVELLYIMGVMVDMLWEILKEELLVLIYDGSIVSEELVRMWFVWLLFNDMLDLVELFLFVESFVLIGNYVELDLFYVMF